MGWAARHPRLRRGYPACASSGKERRGVVAQLRRRGETQHQPRSRPAPNTLNDMNFRGRGLGWHGPTHALRARVPPVVEAPRRSLGYAVVASPDPRFAWVPLWGRGIPGTRAKHGWRPAPLSDHPSRPTAATSRPRRRRPGRCGARCSRPSTRAACAHAGGRARARPPRSSRTDRTRAERPPPRSRGPGP